MVFASELPPLFPSSLDTFVVCFIRAAAGVAVDEL